MIYNIKEGILKEKISRLSLFFVGLTLALAASLATFSPASALSVSGCSFDDSTPGIWSLEGDCSSSSQINVPANTTVEGNGYTISPTFSKTDNSNNSTIGIIEADNVTINNLTIDGTLGTDLHGINAVSSENVSLNDVTLLNNDRTGLVVNGSTVTVDNITTGGNGWHGINVDLGSGVDGPATLTVNGFSNHTDLAHIYVDDSTKDVSVIDTNSQYVVTHPGIHPNDELYTLKTLDNKDDCKNGGYAAFGFRNQGLCIQYVNTGKDSR